MNIYGKRGGGTPGPYIARQKQKPEGFFTLRLPSVLRFTWLALDESFFLHLLVAEPQVGDIG